MDINELLDHLRETYSTLSEGVVGDRIKGDVDLLQQRLKGNFPLLREDSMKNPLESVLGTVGFGGITRFMRPGVPRDLGLSAKRYEEVMDRLNKDSSMEGLRGVWETDRVLPWKSEDGESTLIKFIDDSSVDLNKDIYGDLLSKGEVKLGDLLEHKELTDHYGKDLFGIRLNIENVSKLRGDTVDGFFDKINNTVNIGRKSGVQTLLHELDHGLQHHTRGSQGGGNVNQMERIFDNVNIDNPDTEKVLRLYQAGERSGLSTGVLGYEHLPGEVLSNIAEARYRRPTEEFPLDQWVEMKRLEGIPADYENVLWNILNDR